MVQSFLSACLIVTIAVSLELQCYVLCVRAVCISLFISIIFVGSSTVRRASYSNPETASRRCALYKKKILGFG